MVILLAILIDLLITNILSGMGIALPIKPIFSTIVTIYLCGIELASCFWNTAMIGVPIPKFLDEAAASLSEAERHQAGCFSELSLQCIQQRLGHKDISTTLGIYTGTTSDVMKVAAVGADEALRG